MSESHSAQEFVEQIGSPRASVSANSHGTARRPPSDGVAQRVRISDSLFRNLPIGSGIMSVPVVCGRSVFQKTDTNHHLAAIRDFLRQGVVAVRSRYRSSDLVEDVIEELPRRELHPSRSGYFFPLFALPVTLITWRSIDSSRMFETSWKTSDRRVGGCCCSANNCDISLTVLTNKVLHYF